MFAALALAATLAAGHGQEPVKVALSGGGRYEVGQSVRVEVTAQEDGHLLVLQASPDGVVRVLFPIDPGDDAFVKGGGRTYQLRDRGGRAEAFRVADRAGRGLVLVALSPSPLSVDASSQNGHWDYRQLTIGDKEDLEAGLSRLAGRLAGPRLRYDIASYGVDDAYADAGYRGSRADYLGVGYGAGWGWPGYYGWGYSPFLWDPWYGYGFGGLGYGFGGFGWSNGCCFGGWGGGWGGWGGGWGRPIIVGGGGRVRPAQPYGGRFADRGWGRSRTFNGGVVNPSRGGGGGGGGRGGSVRPSGGGGSRPSAPAGGGGHGTGGRSWGGRPR